MTIRATKLILIMVGLFSINNFNLLDASDLNSNFASSGADRVIEQIVIKYKPHKARSIKEMGYKSDIDGLDLIPIEKSVHDWMISQGRGDEFIELMPQHFIGTFASRDKKLVLQQLDSDESVDYYEQDHGYMPGLWWGTETPNDPWLPNVWGMYRIGAPYGWGLQSAVRAPVKLAIYEYMIDTTRQDLVNQWSSTQDPDPDTLGWSYHSTLMALVAVATGNNNHEAAGVANVELVSLRFQPNYGPYDMAINVSWAVSNGIKVISMSWSWLSSDTCLLGLPYATDQDIINYATGHGVVFVSSAGNFYSETDNCGRIPYPAAYDNVLGISAIDETDTLAWYSAFGPYIDLTAPDSYPYQRQEEHSSRGTSEACPYVAGSAAAILAIDSAYHSGSIPRLLILTAEDLGEPGWDPLYGYGLVRVDRAINGIADVYAESGNEGIQQGNLKYPYNNLYSAFLALEDNETLGLVGGSSFNDQLTISKPCKIISIGGTAVIGQ